MWLWLCMGKCRRSWRLNPNLIAIQFEPHPEHARWERFHSWRQVCACCLGTNTSADLAIVVVSASVFPSRRPPFPRRRSNAGITLPVVSTLRRRLSSSAPFAIRPSSPARPRSSPSTRRRSPRTISSTRPSCFTRVVRSTSAARPTPRSSSSRWALSAPSARPPATS